jgi:hypothetical protein
MQLTADTLNVFLQGLLSLNMVHTICSCKGWAAAACQGCHKHDAEAAVLCCCVPLVSDIALVPHNMHADIVDILEAG